MLIVKIMGGLGNQMYQYAFSRGLVHKTGQEVRYDLSFYDHQDPAWPCCFRNFELERVFGLRLPIVESNIIGILKRKAKFNWFFGRYSRLNAINPLRCDRQKVFQPEMWSPIWPADTDIYYQGYWQHEAYFDFIMDEIKRAFVFRFRPTRYVQEVAENIQATQSVGLHFRRTDFVGSKDETSIHYYHEELKKLGSLVDTDKTRCFAFSDDISWVKKMFKTNLPVTYVDKTTDQAEDMYLMSACKHLICAPASSFSQWAKLLHGQ